MIYDYRIKANELEDIAMQLDNLSEKQLRRVAKVVEKMKESEDEMSCDNTKSYFYNAILPILQEFAELTGALLQIEENNQNQIIEAVFKNSYGFDLTEGCRYMRSMFVVANHISISIEEEEVALSFIFDYGKIS
ncbi:MAG: hypothetical protein OSJ62_04700 [Lachnospiraceae bacterium]|nr:hypothetical protein [Lachnospiraceae bacterium]